MENSVAISKFNLRECLKFDGSLEVPSTVVECLACHQLSGIRFIHRSLSENEGVILNDESGLGKVHQVVGYLSATASKTNKCIIICSSVNRMQHWMYHLDLLTQFQRILVDEDINFDDIALEQQEIILTTSKFIDKYFNLFVTKRFAKFIVIDETKELFLEDQFLTRLGKLDNIKIIFLVSNNLQDDWGRLRTRLNLCRTYNFQEALSKLENNLKSGRSLKRDKLELFFLTRLVVLRRYRSHYREFSFSKEDFEINFESWKVANNLNRKPPLITAEMNKCCSALNHNIANLGVHEDSEIDSIRSSLNQAIIDLTGFNGSSQELDDEERGVPVQKKISEPLFDFEHSTEEMPKLEVESSDSETKLTVEHRLSDKIADSTIQSGPFEVPETAEASQKTEGQTDSQGYLEFGQALAFPHSDSGRSVETVIQKPEGSLTEQTYNFPIDRLLGKKSPSSSSTEVEMIAGSKQSVVSNAIFISSSSSNGAGREKSPDLFTDTEDEADETVKNSTQDSFMNLLLKSPLVMDKTVKPAPVLLGKFGSTNVSTPISKLVHGQLCAESETPTGNTSSKDIFADVATKPVDPNRTDNIFEITENNAFGHKIQVHSDKNSMSPLRNSDDVEFVSVLQKGDEPILIVDSEDCTPSLSELTPVEVNKQNTPSTTGSGKSTPRGWLSKGDNRSPSGSRSPSTPKTRKNAKRRNGSGRSEGVTVTSRRRKLEQLFEENASSCQTPTARVLRRRSAPASSEACTRRYSPRKKCFQERVMKHYNQILVSPSGMDSDFD